MKNPLDWWRDLPIQCIETPSDSKVGYLHKYYPDINDLRKVEYCHIRVMWALEMMNSTKEGEGGSCHFWNGVMKNIIKNTPKVDF